MQPTSAARLYEVSEAPSEAPATSSHPLHLPSCLLFAPKVTQSSCLPHTMSYVVAASAANVRVARLGTRVLVIASMSGSKLGSIKQTRLCQLDISQPYASWLCRSPHERSTARSITIFPRPPLFSAVHSRRPDVRRSPRQHRIETTDMAYNLSCTRHLTARIFRPRQTVWMLCCYPK